MTAVDARPAVMQDPSIAVEAGIATSDLGTPDVVQASATGQLIELRPAIDPLSLTQESLHELPDRRLQFQALTTLRRRSYDPAYRNKLIEVYPEGQPQYALSFEEEQVFDAETRLMADPEREPGEQDVKALKLLLGVTSDDDVKAVTGEIRKEGRIRDDGQVLIGAHEIRGYNMGRQVLRVIDRQIDFERNLGRRLEELVGQFGTDAYLSAGERESLEKYRKEEAMRKEYERHHVYHPGATAVDMQIIQRSRYVAQDYTD